MCAKSKSVNPTKPTIWHQWKLSALLEGILQPGEHDVPRADVIEALTIHRCVEPDSKLAAQRWYPTTALPELQHIAPGQLNNTRLHRVLSDLENIEDELQLQLGKRIEAKADGFVTFFCDVTDTHFVGRGPDMAHKARTKEGLYRRKIGIALMCDQRGYPIRWKTVAGSYHEAQLMGLLIDEVSQLGWLQHAPVVADRAMGRSATVEKLVDSGIRFITAVPVNEFDSYTDRIPYQSFASIEPRCTDASYEKDVELARQTAKKAGLSKVSDCRHVLDLGVIDKGEHTAQLAPPSSDVVLEPAGPIAGALRTGRIMRAALDSRQARSLADLGREYDCAPSTARRYLTLAGLRPELQDRILHGEAARCTLNNLAGVATLKSDDQLAAFELLLATAERSPASGRRPHLGGPASTEPAPLTVRMVAHFNPERFVNQRRIALDQTREISDFVNELNAKLRSPRSRKTEASILGDVQAELRRYGLLGAHDVTVDNIGEAGKPSYVVCLKRDEVAWSKLRRYDGFNLLVTSADLPCNPAEVVHLYFAKDAVEKDFQTIKSELDLHPVRHRTDAKVRAHVILCMLALLLERALENQLAQAGIHRTAPSCLEALRTCHLNHMTCQWGPAYTVTELDPDQRALLRALNLEHLADDEAVADTITPR